jgi:hypothetical protein
LPQHAKRGMEDDPFSAASNGASRMAVFRFLAALFALIAIVAFVADATPRLSGTGPFVSTALETQWERISPNSLKSARESLSNSVSPAAWSGLEAVALGFPTWGVFGTLAVLCGIIGRRRYRINVFVN